MMKILVINAGSSSLKYQLINMDDNSIIAKGICERIGLETSTFTHKTGDGRVVEKTPVFPTHTEAFAAVKDALVSGEGKVLESLSEIGAIGHRIVHGGELFTKSARITEDMLVKLNELSPLAPLHNPPGIAAVRACMAIFGENVPEVAVFDTSFHQTMPAKAYMYGFPYEYYKNDGIRRYGFHGTSHRYVSEKCAEILGKPASELKIVTCHLGNGSSVAAIDGGKSVDTSMGFTPLAGVMMGSRTGDFDPSIIPYLIDKYGYTTQQVNDLVNKKSGIIGLFQKSSDMRDIEKAVAEGDEMAKLVTDMLGYQIKKYIGAYAAAMGGLDAIVYTGGIGENDVTVRQLSSSGLEFIGVEIDAQKNKDLNRKEGSFSTPTSKVQVMIIPTNEELMIAQDTLAIISK